MSYPVKNVPGINIIPLFKKIKNLITGKCKAKSIGKRRIFLSAINHYPNAKNNLNGCINDLKNMLYAFRDYDEKITLLDSAVTRAEFKKQLARMVELSHPGDDLVVHYSGHGTTVPDKDGDESDGYDEAIYLHDGPVIDDELREILMNLKDGVNCLLLFDSCLSGSVTRLMSDRYKGKFVDYGHTRTISNRAFLKVDDLKWTVISGCSENQTSADAYLGGQYEGAFTHYLLEAKAPGQSVKQWYNRLMEKTDITKYQTPTLEGINQDHIYIN